MSALVCNQRLIHYETIGRGPPILFLHSWLGSWRTWMPVMEGLADSYRALALDFWGFGESPAVPEPIGIDTYVEQVLGFVEELGLVTPHLVGHGLGGVVAVCVASRAAARVGRVVIAGTPLMGAPLAQAIQPRGLRRWLPRDPVSALWARLVREAAEGDSAFDEVIADIEATRPATLEASVAAVSQVDLRPALEGLEQPLLAIYGARDRIIPPEQRRWLEQHVHGQHQVLTFAQSGHFPFLDQSAQFVRVLREFFAGNGPVEPKAMWKRRVRQREYLR